jgi:hypothetical protein
LAAIKCKEEKENRATSVPVIRFVGFYLPLFSHGSSADKRILKRNRPKAIMLPRKHAAM